MISKEQVQHIAKLARIKLTEAEEEKFSQELSSILDFVDKLSKVNTSNIERINQITGLETVIREDIASQNTEDDTRDKILKQAPDKKQDNIRVPKILE